MRFLNAIDLGSDNEEKKENSQDQWSTTYFAVLCLENLFTRCDKFHSLLITLVQSLDMGVSLVFLTSKHENYWVRFST